VTVSGLVSPEGGVLYAHMDDPVLSQSLVQSLITMAGQVVPNSTYSTAFLQDASQPVNNKLPPSSAMSFLAYKSDIPTVVLEDFKSAYSNKYVPSWIEPIRVLKPHQLPP